MSLISGSNSLRPVIVGALDLKGAMVEKEPLKQAIGRDLKVCGRCERVFVRAFPLEQRGKILCCCSCRVGVRLTVRSKEDMSDVSGWSQ